MSSASPLLGPSKEVKTPEDKNGPSSERELAQLSAVQLQVAQRIMETPGANIVVPAPPGRGKTFTMTRLVKAMIAAGMCRSTSTVRAIIVAPTNLALQQWGELRGNPSVKLLTAASLVGRGVGNPAIPPTVAVFERQRAMLTNFLIGRALDPQLNIVLVIWDEFWNTPAQDIDNGIELISTVTQTVCVTMVLTGDPFQLKPVEGRPSIMSGPFHELSRENPSMLPRLSRRKLLQNLLTIPGQSHRTINAPDDIVELIKAAERIEMLLRIGNMRLADKELVEYQTLTAGLRSSPGAGVVYLTATRERQFFRQKQALESFEDGTETFITGKDGDDVKSRMCIAVGHEHVMMRYIKDATAAKSSSATKHALSNGTRGIVIGFDEPKKKPKKRKRSDDESSSATPTHVIFQPHGSNNRLRVPITALTTTSAMTVHRSQGATMPDGHRVMIDLYNCGSVYRTRVDLVAALVVSLSRAKNAITVIMNYEPGLLLSIPEAQLEKSGVCSMVSTAFLGAVQRLMKGNITSVVPKKVRLSNPSRSFLQAQLNNAYGITPAVKIMRWDEDTKTATLTSGLKVQAIQAVV